VLELRKTATREGTDLQIRNYGGGGGQQKKIISWLLSTGKCSKSKGSRTFTLTASALFHSEGQVNNVCALDGILIAKLGCLNLEITGVLLVDQSSYRKFKILNSAYWVIFQI